MTAAPDDFPTAVAGVPPAAPTAVLDLADGDELDLRIAPVAKRLGDVTVRMLAYNGSVPGPTLRVRQGTRLTVNAVNDGDLETTVHWHGIRLASRYDGTAETQVPIPVGGGFSYRLEFPDPGVYWYHPHVREDYAQELGLYGTIVVVPSEDDYWPPVDSEVTLTLDDILIEEGRIAPFSRSGATFTAMGRFGNVLLTNGEQAPVLTARRGEVVRLSLVCTANTRVFNVGLPGARLKRVGGDSGRYEREERVDAVVLAPSERVVLDVLFDEAGELTLEHRTPHRTYPLATVVVADSEAASPAAMRFPELRTNPDLAAERRRIAPFLEAPPDKTLSFVAEMETPGPELPAGAAVGYSCPMHPEVMSEAPGRCPKCGMSLVATAVAPIAYTCPMHPAVRREEPGRCPECGMPLVPAPLVAPEDARAAESGEPAHVHEAPPGGHGQGDGGIEWEDDMLAVNRATTTANVRWKVIDRETGAEGSAIDWRFRVGDRVKIRLVNEMESDHPMHHPFHIHGAGRFLILGRDGVLEPNLVWKDTVLVPTGQVVDLLLEVTHPGRWMAHCHIPEHHESGMMFGFDVDP